MCALIILPYKQLIKSVIGLLFHINGGSVLFCCLVCPHLDKKETTEQVIITQQLWGIRLINIYRTCWYIPASVYEAHHAQSYLYSKFRIVSTEKNSTVGVIRADCPKGKVSQSL